jgi:hypothetical protein
MLLQWFQVFFRCFCKCFRCMFQMFHLSSKECSQCCIWISRSDIAPPFSPSAVSPWCPFNYYIIYCHICYDLLGQLMSFFLWQYNWKTKTKHGRWNSTELQGLESVNSSSVPPTKRPGIDGNQCKQTTLSIEWVRERERLETSWAGHRAWQEEGGRWHSGAGGRTTGGSDGSSDCHGLSKCPWKTPPLRSWEATVKGLVLPMPAGSGY